jgi:O-antigen/teichoic acid export membrane protein
VPEKRSFRSRLGTLLAGDLQVMAVGNVFESGLRFLAFVIYSRALTPAGFGVVVTISAMTQLLSQTTQLGIDTSVISLGSKELARGKFSQLGAVCRSGLWLHILLGGVLSVLGVALAPLLARTYFHDPELVTTLIVAFAGIVVSRLASYLMSVLRTYQRFVSYAASGLASAIFLFSGVLLLDYLDRLTIFSVVTLVLLGAPGAKLVAALLRTPGSTLLLGRRGAPFRDLLHFGKWVWGSALLEAAVTQVNVLLLNAYAGDAATGYFGVAKRFAEFLSLIFEPIRKYLLPKFTALEDVGSIARAVRRTYSRLAWTLLILPPAWLLARPLIPLIEGPEFVAAVIVFQVLVTARLLFVLSKPLAFVTFALKRPQIQTFVHFVGLVGYAAVAVPLISRMGATGSALGMLWFSLIILSAFVWFTWRALRPQATGDNGA